MKKAFLKMHLAVLLWGFTGILGKAISLSVPVLVWYRMLLAGLILGIIITWRKKWEPIPRRDKFKIIGIGMIIAVHWLCFYGSVKLANTSIAVVCLATASVFIAVLDPIINKGKVRAIELIIGSLALSGVLFIYLLHPDKTGEAYRNMKNFKLGLFLGLLAAIISAVFTVFNKPLSEKYRARSLVFGEMTGGFILLSCLLPFYLNHFPKEAFLPVGWDYLWIFLLGYCCTVWGQSLAMSALSKLSAFTTAISVNLEPVYAIILAFLIFKENRELNAGFYWGMGLIFFSVALQIYLSIQKSRKATNKAIFNRRKRIETDL